MPYPTNYGGVIDIFFRIKALHSNGYKIILHCFEYGRGEQEELRHYCVEVHYYKRKKHLRYIFSGRPFIVSSRASKQLLNRLQQDDHPILLEGLHCCWYLEQKVLAKRIIFVRTHNIEHEYYFGLKESAGLLERIYFQLEHRKLRRYEKILSSASALFAIREKDAQHFIKLNVNTYVLPGSLPEFHFKQEKTEENFVLFHGNLGVAENNSAILHVLQNIWCKDFPFKLLIAGKHPSATLMKRCSAFSNVELIANPDDAKMEHLLLNAHIHLLYTEIAAGLKLKLLAALQTRSFVFCNPNMVAGTDLAPFCTVFTEDQSFVEALEEFSTQVVDITALDARHNYLEEHYSTRKNVRLFDQLLLLNS